MPPGRQAPGRIRDASQNVRRAEHWTGAHKAYRLELCAAINSAGECIHIVTNSIVSGVAGPSGAKQPVTARRADDALAALGANHLFVRPPGTETDADGERKLVACHVSAFVRGDGPKPIVALVRVAEFLEAVHGVSVPGKEVPWPQCCPPPW